eukprot:2740751-Pyramimonas_sp.AAC.1
MGWSSGRARRSLRSENRANASFARPRFEVGGECGRVLAVATWLNPRYRVGEKYNSHHDYFSGPSNQMKDDRIATFLIYLKSAEVGGETFFPWAGGKEQIDPRTGWPYRPLDYNRECDPDGQPESAVKVAVPTGSAVLFYNTLVSRRPQGVGGPVALDFRVATCPLSQGAVDAGGRPPPRSPRTQSVHPPDALAMPPDDTHRVVRCH